jgi:hypothetical protein
MADGVLAISGPHNSFFFHESYDTPIFGIIFYPTFDHTCGRYDSSHMIINSTVD